MRCLIAILLAGALLVQPILALGQTACGCCETPASETLTDAVPSPVSGCCSVGESGPRVPGPDGPEEQDDSNRRHDCPASCCLGSVPAGLPASGWATPLTPQPADWGTPTPDRYASAAPSGLTKPPRPVSLV